MLTAALLINIIPSSVTANMSPNSRLHRRSFDYFLLRTFGCVCFVLLPSHEQEKLSLKIRKCIFLRYSFAYKRYRCYDPTTNQLRIVQHVSFFENVPNYNSSHTRDLFFLNTITSTKSFTLMFLLTLLYPFLSYHHIFQSLSLLSRQCMLLLLIFCCLWLLWLPRVISLFLVKIYHAIITLLYGIVPMLTLHILLSFHYLSLPSILYMNWSLILRL